MDFSHLTTPLADLLVERKLRIVTAESCTGGLLSAAFTDLAGSSNWYEGGWVTYSNKLKAISLGVEDFSEGAVSYEVVTQMTRGALSNAQNAHVAIAVSGIAGPTGASPEKPVGFVWIHWRLRTGVKDNISQVSQALFDAQDQIGFKASQVSYDDNDLSIGLEFQFEGSRSDIRNAAVTASINALMSLLAVTAGTMGSVA